MLEDLVNHDLEPQRQQFQKWNEAKNMLRSRWSESLKKARSEVRKHREFYRRTDGMQSPFPVDAVTVAKKIENLCSLLLGLVSIQIPLSLVSSRRIVP